MDLKDYLSMACLKVLCNGDFVLFFLTLPPFFFFAPFVAWMGGKSSLRRTHLLH